jgi:hypothetical protein
MTDKTRAQLIDELAASQQEVSRLLASTAAIQDWQREPAEWSFRYLAAHLAAVERERNLPRIRAIASGEQPHFHVYTESGVDFAHLELGESLVAWREARSELLDFVAELPTDAETRTGIHPAVGEITLLDALDELHDQDLGYARHIRQLIEDYLEDSK